MMLMAQFQCLCACTAEPGFSLANAWRRGLFVEVLAGQEDSDGPKPHPKPNRNISGCNFRASRAHVVFFSGHIGNARISPHRGVYLRDTQLQGL